MRSVTTKCSVLVITVLLFSLLPFSALLATPEAKIGFAPSFNLNSSLPGTSRQFSFVHLADLHIGAHISDYGTKGFDDKALPGDVGPAAENLRQIVNWINENSAVYDIRFVLITGDITDSAERSEFLKAKEILDELDIPYVPVLGNHDIWPYTKYSESRLPVGDRYFNEVFSGQFEILSSTMPGWNNGTRLTPIWNGAADSSINENEGCDSFFQNFAFDYAGYHLIFADFNSRNHNKLGSGSEPNGETFNSGLCKGTLPWLQAHFQSYPYKAAENVLMFWHHPLEADPHAFSTEDFNDIARLLGQKNNKDYSGLVCTGHYHRTMQYDINYGGDTICPGVETGAVMEDSGNIRIFDVWGKTSQPQTDGIILYQDKQFAGRGELFVKSDPDFSDNFISGEKIGSSRQCGSISHTTIHQKPDFCGDFLDVSGEIGNLEQCSHESGASSIWVDNSSIKSKPEITRVTPASALPGEKLLVAEITGSNFRSGASVTLSGKTDVPGSDVYVNSPETITCTFDLKDAVPGSYEIHVTNIDGQGEMKKGAFTVRELSGDKLYFAEGSTGTGFQEYLCLFNPNPHEVTVGATFITGDGSRLKRDYIIQSLCRQTINVNEAVGPEQELSIILDFSGSCINAERIMYIETGKEIEGGYSGTGESTPSECWYFAEGTTRDGFQEWVTVLNPNRKNSSLTFEYITDQGERFTANEQVSGSSRATFRISDHVGKEKDVSLILKSSLPVVAERSMYFDAEMGAIGEIQGGSCVSGARLPVNECYFAEGTTRGGFEQWLCILNPDPDSITVEAAYLPGINQGEPVFKTYIVPGRQRLTISVRNEAGPDRDISIRLSSQSGFIAERSVYFNYKPDYRSWKGGHVSMGAARQGKTWILPEGNSGPGFEQWLCIMNPNPNVTKARITYYFESGPPVSRIYTFEGNSRDSIPVSLEPERQGAFSTVITADDPIVVERPTYFDFHGIAGGSITSGYCLE
ncbi:MAG: metallophosphoesterase [Actinobacteria bacterium]|nr:metallophosphoesterase [Actinomycetota bacterium]